MQRLESGFFAYKSACAAYADRYQACAQGFPLHRILAYHRSKYLHSDVYIIGTDPAVALAYEAWDGKVRYDLPLEGIPYDKRKKK